MTHNIAKIRAALELANRGGKLYAMNGLRQKSSDALAALAELDKPAAEPIGFQSRRKGASDWDGVITHRPPDSYELRECEIRNVYTTPPPAKPALGMFTAEEIEAAYTEGLQESPEITREMWLDSCAYKLIQERTK